MLCSRRHSQKASNQIRFSSKSLTAKRSYIAKCAGAKLFDGVTFYRSDFVIQVLPKPETRDPPKPKNWNRKPETRNPDSEALNPKPGIRSPKPETRNPKPDTRNPESEARRSKPGILSLTPEHRKLKTKTLRTLGTREF